MATRKIDLMHQMFGKTEQVCKNCDHFLWERYRDKTYRKCEVYGVTNSEASDWNVSYQACGLFNKPYPYEGNPIIHCVMPDRKAEVGNEYLEGQLQQSPGDGAELGKEHEPCFVEEVDGTTVLTPLSLSLEIGISLKPYEGAEGGK